MEEKEGQTTEKGRKRRDKDKEVRSKEKAGGSNENKGGKRGWRIGFWNVAELRNKDKKFWNGLRR